MGLAPHFIPKNTLMDDFFEKEKRKEISKFNLRGYGLIYFSIIQNSYGLFLPVVLYCFADIPQTVDVSLKLNFKGASALEP